MRSFTELCDKHGFETAFTLFFEVHAEHQSSFKVPDESFWQDTSLRDVNKIYQRILDQRPQISYKEAKDTFLSLVLEPWLQIQTDAKVCFDAHSVSPTRKCAEAALRRSLELAEDGFRCDRIASIAMQVGLSEDLENRARRKEKELGTVSQ